MTNARPQHTQGDNAAQDVILHCDVDLRRIAPCFSVSSFRCLLFEICNLKSTREDYKTKTQTWKITTLFAASAFIAFALLALPGALSRDTVEAVSDWFPPRDNAPQPRADAQAGGQGKIEGQIAEGTKDAMLSSANGLTVTLHSAAMGATSTISQTTRSDANGRFAFSNLDTISTTRYLLITNYGGVEYFSDILSFDTNQTTLPVTLTVFETTTDPSAIRVSQTHFVFDVGTRMFDVTQIIAVQNAGDRTYIGASSLGPHHATLVLPILPGAQNVQFDRPDADATTLRGDTVLTYTLPFLPGNDQIVYSYALPFIPPTYRFNLKLPFDTAKFRILFPDVGATFQSAQLSAPSPFPTQSGQKFLLSSADNLTAGTTINATFANLPAAIAAPPSGSSTTISPVTDISQLVGGIVLGIAGLAAVVLLLYPLLRRRAATAQPTHNHRMELLQEIADLDDDFEAQKISEAEYKAQRAQVKAELLELIASRGKE